MKEGEPLKAFVQVPYPLSGVSGVNDCARDVAKPLTNLGWEIVFISPKAFGRENPPIENHHYLGTAYNINFNNSEVPFIAPSPRDKFRAQKIVFQEEPDVYVSHQPENFGKHALDSGTPKKKVDGIEKLLVTDIGYFHAQIEKYKLRDIILLWIGKYLLRRPKLNKYGLPFGFTPGVFNTLVKLLDGRIAVSQDTVDCKKKIYPDYIYEIISNPIDTNLVKPGDAVSKWRKDADLVVAYVGRQDQRKGVPYFVEAMPMINQYASETGQNIKFIVGGDGLENRKIHQMVNDKHLDNVEMPGFLSRDEYNGLLRSADIFVLPAIGGEGWGRTIAEAMASEKLVVASNISGYREVTREMPFTRTPESKNPQQIADGVIEFAKMTREQRKNLGQEAREYVVANFDTRVIAGKIDNYVRGKVQEHGKPTKEDWERARKTLPKEVCRQIKRGLENGLKAPKKVARKFFT